MTVNGVLGPIDPGDLGVTLMHEHTAMGFAGAELDYRLDRPSQADYLELIAGLLRAAAASGVRTIVDAAPFDLGRDVVIDAELARMSGINIVCSTGLYSLLPLPQFANPWRPASADDLAEIFIREIVEGVADTGIRAGVIKVATYLPPMTAYMETTIRAAARAQRATGVPIITHTENGTLGLEQLDLLAEEGADLGRVVIGHNDTADLAYLSAIADRGATVGFDRFGFDEILPDRLRMATVLAMLTLGYADRIVLSHDCNVGRLLPKNFVGEPRRFPATYTRVTDVVVPYLKEAGVTDEIIHNVLVDNPRRLLTGGEAA